MYKFVKEGKVIASDSTESNPELNLPVVRIKTLLSHGRDGIKLEYSHTSPGFLHEEMQTYEKLMDPEMLLETDDRELEALYNGRRQYGESVAFVRADGRV